MDEWVEEGLIAMQSPNDPKPSIKIVNGEVVELDGKEKADFDLIDSYIAQYGIDLTRTEEVMAIPSKELANKIVDPNISREEIVQLTTAATPGKLNEVVGYMNVVEMMMAVQNAGASSANNAITRNECAGQSCSNRCRRC